MLTMEQIMLEVSKELIKVVEAHIAPAFEKIFQEINKINVRLDRIELRLDKIEARLDSLEKDFQEFKQEIRSKENAHGKKFHNIA